MQRIQYSLKPYGERGTAVIKKMKSAVKSWKIRTKLSILMLASAIVSLFLFWFVWSNMGNVWKFLCRFPSITWDEQALIEELEVNAKYYDVPEREENKEEQAEIKSFFAPKDEYTGIYIYEIGGKGLYRAGAYPEITERVVYGSLLDAGYKVSSGEIENYDEIAIEFRNGTYSVMIYSYHAMKMVYPYLLISVLISVGVFLAINLLFINRRMKQVLCLKDEVLQMASGDLKHPVPDCGEDEIGILAEELDKLRTALDENIRQEEESRKANQDLITAISHDLRTPLTILNGYLEVLQLKKIPESMEEEYLSRCLQKTSDIKEMTDKMFEYALVFEETEEVNMEKVPVQAVLEILQENLDFLKLAGFEAEVTMEESRGTVIGDATMLKRIFNNLFSNILKYGDKKIPVSLTFKTEKQQMKITLINTVKKEVNETDSNRIGLKSVGKMVERHGGELYVLNEGGIYTVQVKI